MSIGYFSGNSKVLLSNGQYKNIDQINVGDAVLNIRNEPVTVLEIFKRKTRVVEIKYQNWYEPFYCSNDSKLLVLKKTNDTFFAELAWTKAGDITKDMIFTTENNIYSTILPKVFKIPIATAHKTITLQPSYDLGLLLGLYSGYGSIENDRVIFRFGPNQELIDLVAKLLKSLLDCKVKTDTLDENCYKVISKSNHLVEFFSDFGPKSSRCIPHKFWSLNKDYVGGLFEGLVDFDAENNVGRYIAVTAEMAIVFTWICEILGLSFYNSTPKTNPQSLRIYPLFVIYEQEDLLGKIIAKIDTDLELDCWGLTVDCPTSSVIVNNIVVHTLESIAKKNFEKQDLFDLTNESMPSA